MHYWHNANVIEDGMGRIEFKGKRKVLGRVRKSAIEVVVGLGRSEGPQKRQSPEKSGLCRKKMAEAMGFELMDLLQSTVFKTVALNHSATPPYCVAGAIIPE